MKRCTKYLVEKVFFKTRDLVNEPGILFWELSAEIEGSSSLLKLFSIYSTREKAHNFCKGLQEMHMDVGNDIGGFYSWKIWWVVKY